MNTKKLIFISFLFYMHSAFAYISGADRYEISIGGDIPFYTGAQARYNWSTQYYTKLGAGFAIELFMDINEKLLVDQFGFSKDTKLLTSALINSVVFDLRMGWAKSIYEGPYLELGYNLMLWGTGEVTGQQINSSIGSASELSNSNLYTVDILNHGPTFHLGYRFILVDKLTLNMDFGVYKPLFSRTELNYGDIAVPAGESKKVDSLLVSNIWFLSMGIWFGLSF